MRGLRLKAAKIFERLGVYLISQDLHLKNYTVGCHNAAKKHLFPNCGPD